MKTGFLALLTTLALTPFAHANAPLSLGCDRHQGARGAHESLLLQQTAGAGPRDYELTGKIRRFFATASGPAVYVPEGADAVAFLSQGFAIKPLHLDCVFDDKGRAFCILNDDHLILIGLKDQREYSIPVSPWMTSVETFEQTIDGYFFHAERETLVRLNLFIPGAEIDERMVFASGGCRTEFANQP